MLMLGVGRLFPRGNRSPAIEPVSPQVLRWLMAREPAFEGWQTGRFELITGGFYKSQAMEWKRA